jgi:hypothetical protein
MYKKMFITLALVGIFGLYIFLNLGNFVDVSKKPVQSDIIVALGGDFSGCRLKEALKLYKQGYSRSGKILYTSTDSVNKSLDKSGSRKQFLLNNGVAEKDIVHVRREMVFNTMEEVLFIKKYMLFHHYKSVLIVSHPQHSRRIQTFAHYIADYKDSGLVLHIAACHPGWWNAGKYYANEMSLKTTLKEIEKLVYNLLKYNSLMIHYTNYWRSDKDKLWNNEIQRKL